MKSVSASVMCVALSILAIQAQAECPTFLNAEQMQECIVTENAGYYYYLRGKVSMSEEETIAPATKTATESSDSQNKIVSVQDKLLKN